VKWQGAAKERAAGVSPQRQRSQSSVLLGDRRSRRGDRGSRRGGNGQLHLATQQKLLTLQEEKLEARLGRQSQGVSSPPEQWPWENGLPPVEVQPSQSGWPESGKSAPRPTRDDTASPTQDGQVSARLEGASQVQQVQPAARVPCRASTARVAKLYDRYQKEARVAPSKEGSSKRARSELWKARHSSAPSGKKGSAGEWRERELACVFVMFDLELSGSISEQELLELAMIHWKGKWDSAKTAKLMEAMDKDHNGEVSEKEFVRYFMSEWRGGMRHMDDATFKGAIDELVRLDEERDAIRSAGAQAREALSKVPRALGGWG